MNRPDPAAVRLEPWDERGLRILEGSLLDPEMTKHVGGPESPEKVAERHDRYSKPNSGQYMVIDPESGDPAGWVGYWDRRWRDQDVYEVGWSVLPAYQGRGLASAGMTLLLDVIRRDGDRRYVHAYPGIDNAPSNAIAKKTGFELLGEVEFEYPPGHMMRCNDWRYDLLG